MAGRDHHTAEGFALTSNEGDGLRRCRLLRDDHVVSAAPQFFCGSECELTREESAIESDDERIAVDMSRRLQSSPRNSDCGAHAPDVIECEVIADDCTPTIRTKSNR